MPKFKEAILKDSPIAFIHIDCNLYYSTKTIFEILGNNIINGTIIVFDEFYGYPNFENHELKAFCEFLEKKEFIAQFLAYNINHEQVAVKILKAEKNNQFS